MKKECEKGGKIRQQGRENVFFFFPQKLSTLNPYFQINKQNSQNSCESERIKSPFWKSVVGSGGNVIPKKKKKKRNINYYYAIKKAQPQC